jgi:folate-dependent phosphoribosylglycinamide formyltransferase PurN
MAQESFQRKYSSINSKFVNIHVGITPKYRGVHGTYWALVNNDVENSGVTVHFVDEGIDTGNIINQAIVVPSKR